MSDHKTFIQEVLSETQNIAPEKSASLFDEAGNLVENAKEQVLDWNSERVKADKEAMKGTLAKSRESYLRQGAELFEKRVSQGLGIDFGKATGDEAVDIIKQHIEAATSKGSAVDPKDEQSVKNSSFYLRMQRENADLHAKLVKEHEAKLNEVTSGYQYRETQRAAREEMMAMAKELNLILPEDPTIRANQEQLIDIYLDSARLEYDATTKTFADEVKDKDGNVIENKQGRAYNRKDWMRDGLLTRFPQAASTQKSSAGDVTKGSKATGAGTGLKKPANETELANERHRINNDQSLDYETRKKLHAELDVLTAPAS